MALTWPTSFFLGLCGASSSCWNWRTGFEGPTDQLQWDPFQWLMLRVVLPEKRSRNTEKSPIMTAARHFWHGSPSFFFSARGRAVTDFRLELTRKGSDFPLRQFSRSMVGGFHELQISRSRYLVLDVCSRSVSDGHRRWSVFQVWQKMGMIGFHSWETWFVLWYHNYARTDFKKPFEEFRQLWSSVKPARGQDYTLFPRDF